MILFRSHILPYPNPMWLRLSRIPLRERWCIPSIHNSLLLLNANPLSPLHPLPNLHLPRFNPHRLRRRQIRLIILFVELDLHIIVSRQQQINPLYNTPFLLSSCWFITHRHEPLHTRIPILNKLKLPFFLRVVINLEKHIFFFRNHAVICGFQRCENCQRCQFS
jgi:hypothetical protein